MPNNDNYSYRGTARPNGEGTYILDPPDKGAVVVAMRHVVWEIFGCPIVVAIVADSVASDNVLLTINGAAALTPDAVIKVLGYKVV